MQRGGARRGQARDGAGNEVELLLVRERDRLAHAERERLLNNAARVRAAAEARDLATFGSTTQISPIGLGAEARALGAMRTLEEHGLLAVAIRPPTVAEGASRLRICLSAAHDDAVVDRLIEAIGDIR